MFLLVKNKCLLTCEGKKRQPREKTYFKQWMVFMVWGKQTIAVTIFLAATSNSTGFAFAISLNMKTQLGELCNIIASIFVDKDGTLLNWLGQECKVRKSQLWQLDTLKSSQCFLSGAKSSLPPLQSMAQASQDFDLVLKGPLCVERHVPRVTRDTLGFSD